MVFHATERLYITRDDRVVREGHPDAHSLLVPRGGEIPFQTAAKYGLVEAPATPPAAAAEAAEEKALDAPSGVTARQEAPVTKALTRKSTKGQS